MASRHTARRQITARLRLAAAVRGKRRHRPELEFTVPRTSRYQAHDEDLNETSGRLRASSRHRAFDAEPSDDPA
jgi:hypothetical protein